MMRQVALLFAGAVLVAACSSAPAASTPSRDSGSASVSPSSPDASTAPAPTDTLSPSPDVTLAPTPSPTPRPSAPAITRAPTGAWSAVHWVDAGPLLLRDDEVTVRGWSGGFVAFEQSPGSDNDGNDLPVRIRASFSPDGLRWSTPTALETGFKGSIAIASVVDGPAGLLALAYPYGDTCGGPPSVVAMWTSPDGRAWERVAMPPGFATSQIATISGGPAGYIAFGTRDDGTAGIWTSAAGRAWRSRPLPTVSSGTLALDGAVAFGDGFVLAGSVLGEEGCGGAAHIQGASWFSDDGSSWTRINLPGSSVDRPAAYRILTLMGRLLIVEEPPTDSESLRTWMSTDGRSWTPVAKVAQDLLWGSISDGFHAVRAITPEEGIGAPRWIGYDENGAAVSLRSDGDEPLLAVDGPGWDYAVGPTGVLATLSDGSASRLGMPR